MDLSLGDWVFYTRSNGVRVLATVVGMAGDGLIHLEYYQDALRVVNRQCKMQSMFSPTPPLYKLRPCPSYSRCRDRDNCVRNLITYKM